MVIIDAFVTKIKPVFILRVYSVSAVKKLRQHSFHPSTREKKDFRSTAHVSVQAKLTSFFSIGVYHLAHLYLNPSFI